MQEYNAKTNEFHISSTTRPHYASVNQVCTEDGFIKFGMDCEAVDQCVALIMGAIQGFSADVVVTALGIAVVLLIRRFEFSVASYFNFIENYLKGDDLKFNCFGLQRMLHSLYETHVARHEVVKFNKTYTVKF